jgi:Tfp pilus assembly PilM family ATPase
VLFANTELIGLDIGTDSVKMVEVDHAKGSGHITTFGIERHQLEIDGYWNSTILRSLSKTINNILNKSDFIGVKTVMSVRSKDVYVTTMDFAPTATKQQIAKEINEQAPYFLPYPPEEMRLSWSTVTLPPGMQKKRIVINAIPDFVIENAKNLLEHINLDGVALENQTLSQIRAICPENTGNTILIDVGASHTIFSILVDKVLRATTFINSGSGKMSRDISEALGVDAEIADHFKKDLGLVNLTELPAPFLDYFEIVASELRNFEKMNIAVGQKAERVLITGGGAYSAGLVTFLIGQTSLPVTLQPPTQGLLLSTMITPYISPFLHELSTAIGLAKRSEL